MALNGISSRSSSSSSSSLPQSSSSSTTWKTQLQISAVWILCFASLLHPLVEHADGFAPNNNSWSRGVCRIENQLGRRRPSSFSNPARHPIPSWTTSSNGHAPKVIIIRRMATVEDMRSRRPEEDMRSQTPNKAAATNVVVIFQKVVRPARNMPDILFLGTLVEYLEQHFALPPNLSMVYEVTTTGGNQDDNNDNNNNSNNHDRFLLAWDSPLSSSPRETRMEIEVVGIYTDGKKTKKKQSPQDGSDNNDDGDVPLRPSVPNMAMVVVRKAKTDGNDGGKNGKKSIPPMMKGLFADSERKILQALDRALDDFIAGNLPKSMVRDQRDPERSPQRVGNVVPPPNVRTAQEAMDAEWLHEVPNRMRRRTEEESAAAADRARDVIVDAYATTSTDGDMDRNGDESDRSYSSSRSKSTVKRATKATTQTTTSAKNTTTAGVAAAARVRAMATMNIKAETRGKENAKSSLSSTVASTGNDFAVQAAREAATAMARGGKKGGGVAAATAVVSDPVKQVDYAVAAAARRVAEQRERKQTTDPSSKEDFAVAAARKVAATGARTTKTNNKLKGSTKKTAGRNDLKAPVPTPSNVAEIPEEPKMVTGNSLQIPDDFKVDDYLGDTRAFRMVISKPKNPTKGAKAKKNSSSSEAAANMSSESKLKNSAKIEQGSDSTISVDKSRKLNVKVVDEGTELKDLLDPISEASRGISDNKPKMVAPNASEEEQKQIDILKDAENVMDEIASQTQAMTPEELLKDILKFDEEKKKEEMPGSGFVTGAFEKAKELMKERHSARIAKDQMEFGFKEVEKPSSINQRILDPTESQASTVLSPEEELKAMFAAGQRIADGRITQRIAEGGLEKASKKTTSEQDVDELISKEKSVSSYARVLDEELAELEVCINNSPGEEFDGPRRNPLFDVMSGPEVYNPNVELDSVNYPGALPGTKDVKLPKELVEAIRQAEFATNVLMNMKTIEFKDANGESKVQYFSGNREISREQVENLQDVVTEASRIGIIDNPIDLLAERSRLQLILDELWNQPEERFYEIASNYKDLLLSDRFVMLVRERLRTMADRDLEALRRDDESLRERHEREREVLGQLVVFAQALLKEARALGAELEAHQLEVVRSICKVAMDPCHNTEEETAMALSDAVRDMRPLLDDVFVAYLKYAVAEEEAKLARAGLLDDPDHNQWLFVLKIVQQGVYAEIAKGINRYIEHIWYVLRMETPRQRRLLLESLINDMPTLDVRPFVQVVDNIVGSLGDGARGEFDGVIPLGEMTNKLLQLHRDVQELLPPERIALKSRDADEWAARQKKRLLEQRKIGEQRLQAARDTEHLQGDVDALGRSGEMERIE